MLRREFQKRDLKKSEQKKRIVDERKVHGRLNASWKICSLAVNGQY